MKPDINSQKDIRHVIKSFYDKLINDAVMYPFFEEFIKDQTLELHIDDITDFWGDILFDTTNYHQNVLKKHIDKNNFIKFQRKHFKLWLSYFTEAIDESFSGLNSDLMKNRAQSIATVMQLKMDLFES